MKKIRTSPKMSRRQLFRNILNYTGIEHPLPDKKDLAPDFRKARAEFDKKKYVAARKYLEMALASDPEHESARMMLGIACYHTGDYDRALELFEADAGHTGSEYTGPDSPAILFHGLILAKKQDNYKAIRIWQKYQDMKRPLVLREINLQAALAEEGEISSGQDMVDGLEKVMRDQGLL